MPFCCCFHSAPMQLISSSILYSCRNTQPDSRFCPEAWALQALQAFLTGGLHWRLSPSEVKLETQMCNSENTRSMQGSGVWYPPSFVDSFWNKKNSHHQDLPSPNFTQHRVHLRLNQGPPWWRPCLHILQLARGGCIRDHLGQAWS